MPVIGIHHSLRMTGLQLLRGNDLCLEVVEGQIPKCCLGLVLSCSTKTVCPIFPIFYLFSEEQTLIERSLCTGRCWKISCVLPHTPRLSLSRLLPQTPQNGWLRNKTCISRSSGERGSPGLCHQQIRCLVRSCLIALSDVSSRGRGRGITLGSLCKGAHPIHEGSTLTTPSPPKASTFYNISSGLGSQHKNLGGTQPFSS